MRSDCCLFLQPHISSPPLLLSSQSMSIRLSSHSHPKLTSYQQGHKTVLIFWFSVPSPLFGHASATFGALWSSWKTFLSWTSQHFSILGFLPSQWLLLPIFLCQLAPCPPILLLTSLWSTLELRHFLLFISIYSLGNFLPVLWLQRSCKWWGISNLYSSPNPNCRLTYSTT